MNNRCPVMSMAMWSMRPSTPGSGIVCTSRSAPAWAEPTINRPPAIVRTVRSTLLMLPSLDRLHVDDLHAALFDERAAGRNRLGHLVGQQLLTGLMFFQSHDDVDVAFVVEDADGIAGFCAHG